MGELTDEQKERIKAQDTNDAPDVVEVSQDVEG